MALTGTFEELTNLFIFAGWIFYGFAVVALFRLRKTEPDLPRPYRCWGYPWVPGLFVSGACSHGQYLDSTARPLQHWPTPDSRRASLLSALDPAKSGSKERLNPSVLQRDGKPLRDGICSKALPASSATAGNTTHGRKISTTPSG